MATIRKTTYRCDVCGNEVEKKADLVQIRAEKGIHSRYSYQSSVSGVKADFCLTCENALIDDLARYYGGVDKVAEQLARPKPKPKKVVKPK